MRPHRSFNIIIKVSLIIDFLLGPIPISISLLLLPLTLIPLSFPHILPILLAIDQFINFLLREGLLLLLILLRILSGHPWNGGRLEGAVLVVVVEHQNDQYK